MNPLVRKPLSKMESKDAIVAFRVAPSIKAMLVEAAIAEGEEFSSYCRECLLTGHSLRAGQRVVKATGV